MCAYCLSETFFLRTWTSLVARNALQSKDILHQIGKYLSWMVCKAVRKKYSCWCDYLDLPVVDDVFWYTMIFHDFCSVFQSIFIVFWLVIMVFQGILMVLPSSTIKTNIFEVLWPSYAIIFDGCQPSVQRRNVCDVSLKSNLETLQTIWILYR